MAITSGMTVFCKRDFMRGVHQPGDEYMIALYGPDADLSPLTTERYSSKGEVQSKGYRAGGMPLQGYVCELDGTRAVMGWSYDPVWKNTSIKAYGALIYNASKDNAALAVVEFAEPIISTNGNFRVSMPDVRSTQTPLWLA